MKRWLWKQQQQPARSSARPLTVKRKENYHQIMKKNEKTDTEKDSLIKELRGLIPKLDSEGLAFLVKQARVHLVMGLQQVFMANLRKRRKQLGFTQEKLAEMCNTDPCYIRQIEIGRRFPSLQYVERIAQALGIAPYRLFYDETDMDNDESFMSAEQKEKIKSMLRNNASDLCSLIDAKY